MRIKRTLPPAAAPIYLRDLLSGILAIHRGQQELDRFEAELKDYFHVKYCFLVSSGKAALTLILNSLKELYPHKKDVLIPAYTCYSVPSAIVRARLNIQPCDMDSRRLDFDYTQLSNRLHPLNPEPNKPNKLKEPNKPKQPNELNNSLLCIIPTHLFGIPSDIERLHSILGDTDVVIVEDAAQAMGGKWKGKHLGTVGDVSFFSLGRGKALSTIEGGVILTSRDDIAKKISLHLNQIPRYTILELLKLITEAVSLTLFMHPNLFWLPKSLPFLRLGETIYDPVFKIRKMSSFQAGLARSWQAKLEKFQKIRKMNSTTWSKLINDFETHELSAISQPPDADLIRFPVRVENPLLKKSILRQSEQKGHGIMTTYPDAIHGIPALKKMFKNQEFPAARQYSQELITLPIHPYVLRNDTKSIKASLQQRTQ